MAKPKWSPKFVPQSAPEFPEADVPDTDHKYGKVGGSKRTFTILNNPEVDDDGVMRYSLFEVTPAQPDDTEYHYEVVGRDMEQEAVDAFVATNGVWQS